MKGGGSPDTIFHLYLVFLSPASHQSPFSVAMSPHCSVDPSVTLSSWWVHTGRIFLLPAAFVFHFTSPTSISQRRPQTAPREGGSFIYHHSSHPALPAPQVGNGSPLCPPLSSRGVSWGPYLPLCLQSSLSNTPLLLFPLLKTFRRPSLPARCSSRCLVSRESLRGSGPWAFLQPSPGLQPGQAPSSPPQRSLSSLPLLFLFVQKASPCSLTPLFSPTRSGLIRPAGHEV